MPKIRAAFAATREPKPLHFDPGKLKGLSERLIQSHWENNYIGSVKALNMIEARLRAAMQDSDLPPLVYGGMKREELHRVGSVILHEHYFDALGGEGKPGGALVEALKTAYGSVEAWEAEFRRTALSLAWLRLVRADIQRLHRRVAKPVGMGPYARVHRRPSIDRAGHV